MKKWYDEEYEFQVEVTGFLRGDHTGAHCRNGRGRSETAYLYLLAARSIRTGRDHSGRTAFPLAEAVSGGDLENVGGSGPLLQDIVWLPTAGSLA